MPGLGNITLNVASCMVQKYNHRMDARIQIYFSIYKFYAEFIFL